MRCTESRDRLNAYLDGELTPGEAGVMRAEWPDALLNRDGGEWSFSMLEAARMQRVLASIVRHPFENEAALDPLLTDSIPHSIPF